MCYFYMIKVYVKKQSNYPVSTRKVKKKLSEFLKKKGIVSDADVTVSVVGEKRMLKLADKYLGEKNTLHNVLSFPFLESDNAFVEPPDDTIHLGDIIVCYPKVVEESKKEGVLIDNKVLELVEHGALHLLGEHHD